MMGYSRGVADMAHAIGADRPPRLPPEFSANIVELAMHFPEILRHHGEMATTFDPVAPMDWAI